MEERSFPNGDASFVLLYYIIDIVRVNDCSTSLVQRNTVWQHFSLLVQSQKPFGGGKMFVTGHKVR
ncbi:MAG: hypothetical protein DCC43_14150 [Candidatus Brocadia sp.]|nr:hypothetical protein [Candidatus Brocadia sp.]MCE7912876.1 hypothetical protein [Candidatus Brocadia sp. AMX3]RIJ91633.1 MAG: hypothetical protein DCC43_14150 [Candidatus Brocadia sp.]